MFIISLFHSFYIIYHWTIQDLTEWGMSQASLLQAKTQLKLDQGL